MISLILSLTLIHSLSASAGGDYVASSVGDEIREEIPAEEKISVHSALPVHLKYAFSFTDNHIPHYLPGGYQGIGVGIWNPGGMESGGLGKADRYIGNSIMTYVFQGGPFWHSRSGLSLNYEWNFGASFGWKPYSEDNKYFNLTVGSRINAYINLSLFLQYRINPYVSVFGGVTASHFSNGNTSWPNPGVNSMGVKLGVTVALNPSGKEFEQVMPDTVKKRKLQYDIMAWGAERRRVYKGGDNPVLLPGHFVCAGISFAPMWRLNSWWRIGGSADIQWDQSSDKKKHYISGDTTDDIRFSKPDFFRQLTVGLSAHGELQMPIFSVNVGIGYNFVSPWENRGFYQNIALKTYIGNHFFVNVGYQLRNFVQQSSLMLGAGYTI